MVPGPWGQRRPGAARRSGRGEAFTARAACESRVAAGVALTRVPAPSCRSTAARRPRGSRRALTDHNFLWEAVLSLWPGLLLAVLRSDISSGEEPSILAALRGDRPTRPPQSALSLQLPAALIWCGTGSSRHVVESATDGSTRCGR
jgi:hypothetical protein